jgi:hypothetical protein
MDTAASPVISFASGIPRARVTTSPCRPSLSSAFNGVEVRAEVRCLGGSDGWRAVEQALRAAGGGPLLCRLAASTDSKVATKALRLLAFLCRPRGECSASYQRGLWVYHTTHLQA